MTLSFSEFISGFFSNPALAITALLTIGVIIVNGWTDAPNAIATCVVTRAMGPKAAVIMAALGNFLGVFVMTKINNTVAMTIYNMVDFGGDAHEAMIALCAALFAIDRSLRSPPSCWQLLLGRRRLGFLVFPPVKATR